MSRKLKALICIAHPDDEAIFFGGLLASRKYDWTIVCATDADADGLGVERKKRFQKSCKLLGVKTIIYLDYPDIFNQRLDSQKLVQDFQRVSKNKKFDLVFTHGILGEYGHQHHQDVCFAVYQSFSAKQKIYSVAYNTFPELRVSLSKKLFDLKTKILWKIYSQETKALLHFLPATSDEGFVRLSLKEVNELYMFFLGKNELNKKNLKVYAWLAEYIAAKNYELKLRPF